MKHVLFAALVFLFQPLFPESPSLPALLWSEGPKLADIEKALVDLETSSKSSNCDFLIGKSHLLSVQLRRTWETKKGYVRLLSLLSESKSFHENFMKQFPGEWIPRAGLADYYNFLPGFLGGSKEKAEKLYLEAASNADPEALYRRLLFYLNAPEELPMKEARSRICADILGQLEKSLPGDSTDPRLQYLKRWTTYQRGVWLFFNSQPREALATLRRHLAENPRSYWAWYFLWRIGRSEPGLVGPELPSPEICFQNATKFGAELDDPVFIERIQGESRKK